MRAIRNMPALLATGVAVVIGLSGAIGTGSAIAEEPGEQCITEFLTGTEPYKGEGSSLQKVAQEVWTGLQSPLTLGFNVNKEGCNGERGKKLKTKVMYTADGSSAGLEAFGVGEKKSPAESKDIFIGTDDAPNETQLKEIDKEAKGVENKGQALVIPVAQAAIAMIANPPTGCALKKHHITNKNLQEIWAEEITEWGQIATIENKATCEKKPIKRVVREDGSGTTYQFKHYLHEIRSEEGKGVLKPTKAGEPGRTWEELQPETTRNLEWPEESKVVRPAGKGGAEEVKTTYETEGGIGYANLSDARGGITHNNFTWFAVENARLEGLFEFPGTSEGEPSATSSEANCEKSEYPGVKAIAVGPDDNWSGIYGGHTGKGTAKNEHYPICTLTWDVALVNYELAGYTEAHNHGQAAFDYLNYVVAPKGGQEDFHKFDYGEVEKVVGKYAQEEAKKVDP